jgi:hypothetical protein
MEVEMTLALALISSSSQARIHSSDGGLVDEYCMALQNDSDLLRAELATASPLRAFYIGIELVAIGDAWDDFCDDLYGSIARDHAGPGVPTYQDSDGDGVYDEDELVYGLDLRSPDTDQDGLDDGVDPSWLAPLLRGSLADTALLAEGDVRLGDRSAAVARLEDVQLALGGCSAASEVCLAVWTLAVNLECTP